MDLSRFRESEDCSSEDAVHKVYSRKRDLSALYGRDLDLTASFYVRPAEEQKERMSSLSSGSGGDEDAKNRSRKARTAFSDSQLGLLEATFEQHKYLSVEERTDLSRRLGLSDTQVKTWFQNRR